VIIITVASYNGTPLPQALAAQFDELGGNIGRAENNQLVLPDPERTISRVHAQVVFRSGRYAIVDRGSNPISVNGRALGNGQEAPLQSGDEVQIGGYRLRVETGASGQGAAAADPFADFGGLAAPAPGAGRAAAASMTDPLAAFGMAPAPAPLDPFARGGGGFGAAPAAKAPSAAGGIPHDWDPFAPDPKTGGGDFARSLGQSGGGAKDFGLEVGGRAATPLIPDLPGQAPAPSDSLDNLFGLGAGAGSGGDPLANSVLGQAAAQPNMAAHADPMRSLNSMTRATSSAAADTGSELRTPFNLGPMTAPEPASPPAARVLAPAAAIATGPAAPKGAVLSWNEPTGDRQTVIRPRGAMPAMPPLASASPQAAAMVPDDIFLDLLGNAPASPAAHAPALPVDPPVAARPVPAAATVPPPRAQAAPAMRPVPGPADTAALISALREGLGVHALPIDSLTPEFMRLLGQLVHEATRGTVDLLVARAALKREVRAELTMIVAKENNPLKFSPTVDVALGHLLSPPARGFMPPDRAMRDAYDDLRAHQFGFLAGMKAALEGVLNRFDPAVLEGKLTQKKSVLSTLVPATRKARMWEAFIELYAQISAEASDDFHELFGKEFLRAYEAYIDRLERDR
jgi:FHA domain-containing protein